VFLSVLKFSVDNAISRRHPLAQKGDTLEIVKARITRNEKTANDAASALRSGKIRDPIAQALLAFKVLVDGDAETAATLLKEGVVSEEHAQWHLLRKIAEEIYGGTAYELLIFRRAIDSDIRLGLEESMRGFIDPAQVTALIEKRKRLNTIIRELTELIGNNAMRQFNLLEQPR